MKGVESGQQTSKSSPLLSRSTKGSHHSSKASSLSAQVEWSRNFISFASPKDFWILSDTGPAKH
jgi:hypothetical protein